MLFEHVPQLASDRGDFPPDSSQPFLQVRTRVQLYQPGDVLLNRLQARCGVGKGLHPILEAGMGFIDNFLQTPRPGFKGLKQARVNQ